MMKFKVSTLKLLVSALILALLLSACGGSNSGNKAAKSFLSVYNWGDYIDPSVIDLFEEKYNVDVVYDPFTTNEDMYIKIKSGGSNYDVLFPSDYMIKRMKDEDMLADIDLKNIPNYQYIDSRFKNLDYDPNNEYSVPYMWGTVGILYNKTMVKESVDSWRILWNENYKDSILMQDSVRDCIGITLKMLGYSMNTQSVAELEAAKQELIKQKHLVMAYDVDQVKDKMIGGESALAVVWSGDGVFCQSENEDLEYVIPKEGSNLWFDGMVITKNAKNKDNAEKFINFLCDPEIAFMNADYIGYATPHTEARKQLDTELTSNKSFYPEPEDVANCEIFEYDEKMNKEYDRIWTEIKAK